MRVSATDNRSKSIQHKSLISQVVFPKCDAITFGERRHKTVQASEVRGEEGLLWRRRVVDKVDALFNALLQFSVAFLEELLLVRADVAKDIGSLLCTKGLRNR